MLPLRFRRSHGCNSLETPLCSAPTPLRVRQATADIWVLVLEAGGGELAVAATAAALALADAGIEMFDLVTACSVVSLLH